MATIKHYLINNRDNFSFEFTLLTAGYYQIRALRYPVDPRNGGPAVNHLYDDGKICVAVGREPRTLERAIAIATLWAYRYSDYVRTGTFNNRGGKMNV